jgi:hypothetical protein
MGTFGEKVDPGGETAITGDLDASRQAAQAPFDI